MMLSQECDLCGDFHWYDMCEVVDVVEKPELKLKFIAGDLPPFKCKSCDHPTNIEDRVTFVYWEKDWLGIVLPTLEEVDVKWMSNRMQYLIHTTMPERDELPNKAIVFGDLNEFLIFIEAPRA